MSPIGFCKGLVPAGQAILGGGGNFRGWGQEKKKKKEATSSYLLPASYLQGGKHFPLHHLISEDVPASPKYWSSQPWTEAFESFLPEVRSQQCKSNWYGSYGGDLKVLLYMQNYGILYYNTQSISSNI